MKFSFILFASLFLTFSFSTNYFCGLITCYIYIYIYILLLIIDQYFYNSFKTWYPSITLTIFWDMKVPKTFDFLEIMQTVLLLVTHRQYSTYLLNIYIVHIELNKYRNIQMVNDLGRFIRMSHLDSLFCSAVLLLAYSKMYKFSSRHKIILKSVLPTWGDLLSLILLWETISKRWCEKLFQK